MRYKGSFPLTAAQEVILLQQRYSVNKGISNINVMTHFEKEVNDELMLQALNMSVSRNRSASLQIKKIEKNKYEQYFSNTTPQAIEIVDFSDASEEEMKKYLKEEGSKAFPNGCYDVPLYKLKYIIKPDGKRGVYMVANHMIFDSYSMFFMIEDAFDIYESMMEGRNLPKPFRSSLSLFDREKEYIDSPKYAEDLAFWDNVYIDEPLYNSLYPSGSKDYRRNKRTGKAAYLGFKGKSDFWVGRIPCELVQKTRKFAEEHRVSMQSIYLLPIRNFQSRANNFSEDIMFMNSVAHRATLVEKEAGGMWVTPIFIRLRFGNEVSFCDAVKQMTSSYTAYYKHSKFPYMPINVMLKKRFKLSITEGYTSTGVTFQPYAIKNRENLPVHLEYVSNGQSAQGLYITFAYLDNSGDLQGIYEYNLSLYKTPELIEKVHQYLLDSLDYAVEHPDVTLRELMENF